MKRVLLLVSFVALVLAGVASASGDAGACCPAGAAGQAQAHHEMHGKDAGCCAKMAEGKGCCTPDAEGKKACCADGTCEMKSHNANGNGEAKAGCCANKADGEAKAGCCAKKADGETKAGCCVKKAGAEGKAGCCTKPAPQGSRS